MAAEASRLAVFRDWFISYRREAAPTMTAEQNAQGPDWLFGDPVILSNPTPSSVCSKYSDKTAESVRIGVVSCMKAPKNVNEALAAIYSKSILTWVHHHASLGVERIFLHLEDSPALAEVLRASRWANMLDLSEVGVTRTHYFELVDRQNAAVTAIIPRARAAGLTHLLHIDDDELLYPSLGSATLRSALAHAPAAAADLHLTNIEAMPPSTTNRADIFRGVTAFRHEPRRYCAYTNGKSFANLSVADVRPKGPHRFTAGSAGAATVSNEITHEIKPHIACVLHFESSMFALWHAKFCALALRHMADDGAPERVKKQTPFAFYRESLTAAVALLRASAADEADSDSDEDGEGGLLQAVMAKALKLWAKWKLPPQGLPEPPEPKQPPIVLEELGVTLLQPLAWLDDLR